MVTQDAAAAIQAAAAADADAWTARGLEFQPVSEVLAEAGFTAWLGAPAGPDTPADFAAPELRPSALQPHLAPGGRAARQTLPLAPTPSLASTPRASPAQRLRATAAPWRRQRVGCRGRRRRAGRQQPLTLAQGRRRAWAGAPRARRLRCQPQQVAAGCRGKQYPSGWQQPFTLAQGRRRGWAHARRAQRLHCQPQKLAAG